MVLLILQHIGVKKSLLLILCSHRPGRCKPPVMTKTEKMFVNMLHSIDRPNLESMTLVSLSI